MKTTIGAYDPDTRTVPVTFVDGGIKHKRSVNAVLDDAGDYDRKATKARVDEVALGVAAKIQIGAIGATGA
jgi:hypothetical protein